LNKGRLSLPVCLTGTLLPLPRLASYCLVHFWLAPYCYPLRAVNLRSLCQNTPQLRPSSWPLLMPLGTLNGAPSLMSSPSSSLNLPPSIAWFPGTASSCSPILSFPKLGLICDTYQTYISFVRGVYFLLFSLWFCRCR